VTPLIYAARGRLIFPCRAKDRPLVKWREAATTDEATIRSWWKRWPQAQVGLPTGESFVVLDVDVTSTPTGLDTLAELGFTLWFETPTVHTPSGGLHAYFRYPQPPIRNTTGKRGRGIGPNLDWRGVGGYVIAPSRHSGYRWDPHLGSDTPMAEVPAALLPKIIGPREVEPPPRAAPGLSRYGQGALDKACRVILNARHGEQESTLNGECFSIGQLVAGGEIPRGFGRDVLQWTAGKLASYDPRRPWQPLELERKVSAAFSAGMRNPRGARHA